MPGEAGARAGELANDPARTQKFLNRVLDRGSGRLKLQRHGRIWEAAATAQKLGATGEGRLVAVIDGGFDLTVPGLANRLHPASNIRAETVEPTSGHGTAVAFLVREVAPDCELLLIDVSALKPGLIQPEDVGNAINLARAHGSNVINLSLQFPTDCPLRDTAWIRENVLASAAPDAADYVAQVGAWIDHAEPYLGARCGSACAICDALSAVPASTLVVAASGNWEAQSCPACFDRVVGVGFHRTRRVEVKGSVFTTSEFPLSKGPVGRAELLVEEPPGFLGTSFAAPLLSGLGVLALEPAILADMARMSRAITPILTLADTQWSRGPDALPEGAPTILHHGLLRFAAAVPPTHQHFDQDWVRQACMECTLLLIDWYDVFVSMLVSSGNPKDALNLARIAAVLAPETASVSGNYGLAAAAAANQEGADDSTREVLRREAVLAYTNAARLAPDVSMYPTARDQISSRISR